MIRDEDVIKNTTGQYMKPHEKVLYTVMLIIGILLAVAGIIVLLASNNLTLGIILIVGGAVFLVFGVLMIYGVKVSNDVEKNTPVVNVFVRVFSKLTEQDVGGVGGATTTKYRYFVVFEFPDGNRVKLTVDLAQYALLVENDTGVLEYKDFPGHPRFISFTRQA